MRCPNGTWHDWQGLMNEKRHLAQHHLAFKAMPALCQAHTVMFDLKCLQATLKLTELLHVNVCVCVCAMRI